MGDTGSGRCVTPSSAAADANPTSNRRPDGSASRGGQASCSSSWGSWSKRHRAVLEVTEGLPVTEVAGRYGVTRQTVHRWLRWYAQGGIAALADGSHRPAICPHRMAPEVEARIVGPGATASWWPPRPALTPAGAGTAAVTRSSRRSVVCLASCRDDAAIRAP